jgi:exodeoxyribonuclease VII large subunit
MQSPQSVSDLTRLIQSTLENELDPVYWVVGELADFRQAPQGHAYFELVEKQGNQVLAKIKANLWQFTYRSVVARFEAQTGSGLKNGMKVLAQVAVNYHPVYGLSVNVKDIDPSYSLGERARIRQETIERLTKEGLINLNASLELPRLAQKIAVISSPTAAGYGDFVNQIDHNSSGYKIYHKLFPSLMQGNEAVQNIIQAINLAESLREKLQFQAIIIIRGGGAQLDLDCFDAYSLAAKIAQCQLPVFTGIGHERDETIADLVAHTRLKTPTAVAEFLLSGFREFEENLSISLTRLERVTRQKLREEENLINQYAHRIKSGTTHRLHLEHEKLKGRSEKIITIMENKLNVQEIQLQSLEKNLKRAFGDYLRKANERLESKITSLRQLDPETIFTRGYTRTEINGSPIADIDPKIGDTLVTYSIHQKIRSTITEIEKK